MAPSVARRGLQVSSCLVTRKNISGLRVRDSMMTLRRADHCHFTVTLMALQCYHSESQAGSLRYPLARPSSGNGVTVGAAGAGAGEVQFDGNYVFFFSVEAASVIGWPGATLIVFFFLTEKRRSHQKSVTCPVIARLSIFAHALRSRVRTEPRVASAVNQNLKL